MFLLNLQILLFYHKLRFGEHSRIIDFGDTESNGLPKKISEKEETRRSGTCIETQSETSLRNYIHYGTEDQEDQNEEDLFVLAPMTNA